MKLRDFLIEEIGQDIFYDINHINNKVGFLKDCISKSYNVRVDELDAKVSFARKKSKASVNDVFKIATDKKSHSHYVFIVRNMTYRKENPYIEAGLSTDIPRDKTYFIFIYIKLDKLDYFTKKYKLERMK